MHTTFDKDNVHIIINFYIIITKIRNVSLELPFNSHDIVTAFAKLFIFTYLI